MVLDFISDAQSWLMSAWEWLNDPLPVVGVSTLILCGFAIKLFSSTSFGKKNIKNLKNNFTTFVETVKSFMTNADAKVLELENKLKEQESKHNAEIEFYKTKMIEICEAVRNSKLKEIAKEIIEHNESKEETNIDTKEE
ncbi:MAG: hypothetical protein PHX62_09515 [Bacilli bacterium]|nr:hypothetical protein [Bacilli bacterium]